MSKTYIVTSRITVFSEGKDLSTYRGNKNLMFRDSYINPLNRFFNLLNNPVYLEGESNPEKRQVLGLLIRHLSNADILSDVKSRNGLAMRSSDYGFGFRLTLRPLKATCSALGHWQHRPDCRCTYTGSNYYIVFWDFGTTIRHPNPWVVCATLLLTMNSRAMVGSSLVYDREGVYGGNNEIFRDLFEEIKMGGLEIKGNSSWLNMYEAYKVFLSRES